MTVTRILRRAAVLGVTCTTLGVGILATGTPAQAMSRECQYYVGMANHHYRAWRSTADVERAKAHFAAYEAAWDVIRELGCY